MAPDANVMGPFHIKETGKDGGDKDGACKYGFMRRH